jgi:hypothetical protein
VRRRVLVADLHNTLYDWVTYFATSFTAMTDRIHEITNIPKTTLFAEFKMVHQSYANSEQPFAALELPSIQKYFGTSDRIQLKAYLNQAFHVFNKTRKQYLRLYETVDETIKNSIRKGAC